MRLIRLSAVVVWVVCWPLSACFAQQNHHDHDPLEPVNRRIFWFNDQVDIYVLEPVAKGWNAIAPKRVQRSIANFFVNLDVPLVFVNNLLQGKVEASASDVGRFAVNSTVGVAGLFDPASSWGLEQHVEDFGQTFGRWGIPPGPYLVLPFFGPSNPRDGVGRIGDAAMRVYPFFAPSYVSPFATGTELINARARALDEVREAKATALDYYTLVRNAYIQHREALVNDGAEISRETEDDLYEIKNDTAE